MFSTEDVRELLQTISPSQIGIGPLPPLILASSGQGFLTLQHVQSEFEHRVTNTKARISISELAQDLDVEFPTVFQLTQDRPLLALLSHDRSLVIPKAERDAIQDGLRKVLSNGVVSKSQYALEVDISLGCLEQLLKNQGDRLVYSSDHVYSEVYDRLISEEALDVINRMVNNITTGDYTSSDFVQMPGSPPKWLFLHHLERLANSAEFVDRVFVRDLPDGIRIQSKQAVAHNVESWVQIARLNNLAYFDLQKVGDQNLGLYDTMADVLDSFKDVPGVDIIDSFVLSKTWFSGLMDSKLQSLHYSETGAIDVLQDFGEKVQNTMSGHRRFPESLFGDIQRKAEQYVDNAIAQRPDWSYHRFGTVVLTDEQYKNEQNALIESAGEYATSQWQQLKEGADLNLKYSFPDQADASAIGNLVHQALLKEKPVQKAADEKFWVTIADLEAQNETDFATFWTDRVDSRVHIHNTGLDSIEDPKLRDQLSDLFVAYIQKELIPDTISKARSQGLMLSRKTKKNVQKLESTLPTSNSSATATLFTLSKFSKKQGITSASTPLLETYKATMIQDMQRRMSKQQKSSDGPVLFLTLVVILHAKHFPGVVYATGKYAPKLLKQMKGKLDPEQYEQVEKWKEAAKTGTLGKEDRERMRGIASC